MKAPAGPGGGRAPEPICNYRNPELCIDARRDGSVAWFGRAETGETGGSCCTAMRIPEVVIASKNAAGEMRPSSGRSAAERNETP